MYFPNSVFWENLKVKILSFIFFSYWYRSHLHNISFKYFFFLSLLHKCPRLQKYKLLNDLVYLVSSSWMAEWLKFIWQKDGLCYLFLVSLQFCSSVISNSALIICSCYLITSYYLLHLLFKLREKMRSHNRTNCWAQKFLLLPTGPTILMFSCTMLLSLSTNKTAKYWAELQPNLYIITVVQRNQWSLCYMRSSSIPPN